MWANVLRMDGLRSKLNDDVIDVELFDVLDEWLNKLRVLEYACEVIDEIDEVKDNVSFLKDLFTGKIPEEEWDDYDFDGDYQDWLNGCLTCIWDICDSYVGKGDKKFCFIQ